jgi:cell volume regulation protein A
MSEILSVDVALLGAAALLVVGVVASGLASRLRAPAFVLFLGIGMVLGDDGLGLVRFDNADLAQRLAVVALVVILFEGGLATSVRQLREVAAPGVALATLGVVVTAGVVALVAGLVFDIPSNTALLLGAVLSSTDATAVFSVIRRAPVPARVASLLEVESGLNDPAAVVLTVGLLAAFEGSPSTADWVVFAVVQIVAGGLVGGGVGLIGGRALRRFELGSSALYPVLGLGLAGLAYGTASVLHGSGFLAAYLAGLVVAAVAPRHRRSMRAFHAGLAQVAEIGLFLMLGFLVFPSQLPIGTGLVVAAILVVLARPLAVLVIAGWARFTAAELTLVGWAGLRGAVPIVLATFPLTAGYDEGQLIFDVVFFVVLCSAAVQGFTVEPLARRLELRDDHTVTDRLLEHVAVDVGGIDVFEVEVPPTGAVVGRTVASAPPPEGVRILTIRRGDRGEVATGRSVVQAGDVLVVATATRPGTAGAVARWVETGAAG